MLSYAGLHQWLVRKQGKASYCLFDYRHSGLYEWANLSGDYFQEIDDFISLCQSCHRKFDAKPFCPKGHDYTKSNTIIHKRGYRVCRECKLKQHRIYYLTKQKGRVS